MPQRGYAPARTNGSDPGGNPLAITDKDLRRLRRVDLLELLVEQGKELERVRAELAQAQAQLEDQRIMIEQSGSIAEAALKLNHVFEAAQSAADQYLENVKRTCAASNAAAGDRAVRPRSSGAPSHASIPEVAPAPASARASALTSAFPPKPQPQPAPAPPPTPASIPTPAAGRPRPRGGARS